MLSLLACATTGAPAAASQDSSAATLTDNALGESSISLVFAGDIMAHKPNYQITDFDRIWRDIAPLVSRGELSFANIEAPVADSIPWSTYPQFNMHSEYVEAAIRAGFNVFSLANNHTNDQSLAGMRETKKYFGSRKGIWACGLKDGPGDPLTYQIIEKNGWRVLFVAVTEILNSLDSASCIDYYPSTEKKREQLVGELRGLQESAGCDLFVVSVHCDEAEYVLSVTESHRAFYRRIIEECGADIVWANHPHVVKPFEEVGASSRHAQEGRKALIMYANGNTVSAQRTNPQFAAPETARDYTGDGLIVSLRATKSADGSVILSDCEPHLITTYITPSRQYVVKLLDDGFISALDRAEVADWAQYLAERKRIMEKVTGGK